MSDIIFYNYGGGNYLYLPGTYFFRTHDRLVVNYGTESEVILNGEIEATFTVPDGVQSAHLLREDRVTVYVDRGGGPTLTSAEFYALLAEYEVEGEDYRFATREDEERYRTVANRYKAEASVVASVSELDFTVIEVALGDPIPGYTEALRHYLPKWSNKAAASAKLFIFRQRSYFVSTLERASADAGVVIEDARTLKYIKHQGKYLPDKFLNEAKALERNYKGSYDEVQTRQRYIDGLVERIVAFCAKANSKLLNYADVVSKLESIKRMVGQIDPKKATVASQHYALKAVDELIGNLLEE